MDNIKIRSTGAQTSVLVNGKELSGNIVNLAMEIKPLEPPKVVITITADEVCIDGVADISCEVER